MVYGMAMGTGIPTEALFQLKVYSSGGAGLDWVIVIYLR